MKKKLILSLAAILVLGLGAVAFAFNYSGSVASAAACCCCSGDSCPMKKKDGAGKETKSCCDDRDCCKDGKCTGDSCPLKKKDNSANESEKSEGKDCRCPCCGKDKEKKDTPAV